MCEPVVSVHCIRHVYPDKTEVSLCGVELEIAAGQRAAVLAANGAGKTTLLQHITGILKPVEGQVRVFGKDPYKDFELIRPRLGVVAQNAAEQIIAPTVAEDVGFGLGHLPRRQRRQRVEEVLDLLGIRHLAGKVPHYLSGGEIKKVALAGVLAPEPELLVLDEPFAGLDPRGVEDLVKLLIRINRQVGTTMVFTSQQLEPVGLLADTVFVLNQGRVVASGAPLAVLINTEVLEQSRLRPPDLVRLARWLGRLGMPVKPALDAAAMAREIIELSGRYNGGENRII